MVVPNFPTKTKALQDMEAFYRYISTSKKVEDE